MSHSTPATMAAAGFIVHDNPRPGRDGEGLIAPGVSVIWGYGDTEADAWASCENEIRAAKVEMVDELPDGDQPGATTLRSGFTALPATAALISDVTFKGGAITWSVVDGIACTPDEAEAGEDEDTLTPADVAKPYRETSRPGDVLRVELNPNPNPVNCPWTLMRNGKPIHHFPDKDFAEAVAYAIVAA